MAERTLAPGEWAVLALLSERPAHGWALAGELGRSGELGSVWSLGRPLVYRSIDILAERGLIERRRGACIGTEAILVRFRLESRRAVLRFVDGLLDATPELRAAV